MQNIGDRIKENYEKRDKRYLTRRMPVIVRVDGRAFHTYTRGMDKPFDSTLMMSMTVAAQFLANAMQGFKVGYVQSDEASFLLTDYDKLETDAWFGYVQNKIESISASIMTAHFNRMMKSHVDDKTAYFDARAFNLPREEVSNYFLWRAMDWERNSVSMYARAFFSHRELNKKRKGDIHEMLYQIGKNWATDTTPREKNGTFVFKMEDHTEASTVIPPKYEEIAERILPLINIDKRD